jgi:DNA-binding IclR family transcriptional regulator
MTRIAARRKVERAPAATPSLTREVRAAAESPRDSSLGKMLRVLDLFTIAEPMWTIEAIAERLGYPQSSTYRYVRELCAFDILAGAGGGAYIVGSRIIELDHQILSCDPVHQAARDLAPSLLRQIRTGAVMVCGLRGDRVMSIFAVKRPDTLDLGVERGRPMELFRGAGAKAILAHFPTRKLMRLYLDSQVEIARAGLGDTWKSFSKAVAGLRRTPYTMSKGEFDPRLCAIAAPIFDGDRRIAASLSMVLPVEEFGSESLERLSASMLDVTGEINARLAKAVSPASAPARP